MINEKLLAESGVLEPTDKDKYFIRQNSVSKTPPRDGEGLPFDLQLVELSGVNYLYMNNGRRWIRFKEDA